jgi:quinol monooxygenase YgiN
MSYCFLSRMKIKPDKDAAFVELCIEMERQVALHEPHVLAYKFYRLAGPHEIAVFEEFNSEAESTAHNTHPAIAPIIAKMLPCMEDGYVREYLLPLK